MGMVIFEQSGVFNPADWGLTAGCVLQVICVGGGAGGQYLTTNGAAGKTSSFGSYVAASGANNTIGAANGMGRGGNGTWSNSSGAAGGGAGGYLPGIPVYGGNGGDGLFTSSSTTSMTTKTAPSLLGGKGVLRGDKDIPELLSSLPFANLAAGKGNKGAGGGCGSGGNGYGAGGGGGKANSTVGGGNGGNSGAITFGTVILASTEGIPVTVGTGGTGGVEGIDPNNAGGNGAPGVVIVTW